MPGLVLTRKKGQSILIGEDVKITVVRLTKSHVRIFISAPTETRILRAELDKLPESDIESG